ncbi:hypothetical protein CK203_114203 [Vitis vinifera]|uniref:Retrotransposon gag domain-containing protein n=1 Tax=Vitis vinifera TaxID=29760 RepID=A0A438FE69_VITVI|nr:hypothetical protein CK203_114203 [Vitis vinifera]
MTLTEYAIKFTQLSEYAPNVVVDEQMRAEQFQEGLRLNIRAQVAPFMLRTYSEVVARALVREKEMEEAQRWRSKNSRKQEQYSETTDMTKGPRRCYESGEVGHLGGMPKISTTCLPAISTIISADELMNPRKATSKGRKLLSHPGFCYSSKLNN